MRATRTIPLSLSIAILLALFGAGLTVQVGADDDSFHNVVVFSEVLSLVMDNYVDPVEAQRLLDSAYEGMLGGLDAHGAFLTPDELRAWRDYRGDGVVGVGISVLQAGRALQIVAIEEASPAAEAGLQVGDQIRSLDGQPVRTLSLDQCLRLLYGEPGTRLELDAVLLSSGFRREKMVLVRSARKMAAHSLEAKDGIAVLKIHDVAAIDIAGLRRELDDLRSRPIERLLIDLRNVADTEPRRVSPLASLIYKGVALRLRDGAGEVVESVTLDDDPTWDGAVAVLVNGATAGSSEALAGLIQREMKGTVFGESTYGMGAEPKLHELEDGSALLVSSAVWETVGGGSWNGDGLKPDRPITGTGADYAARQADQLRQALEILIEIAPEPAARQAT